MRRGEERDRIVNLSKQTSRVIETIDCNLVLICFSENSPVSQREGYNISSVIKLRALRAI